MRKLSSRFLLKLAGGLALTLLADRLFWAAGGVGSNLGVFAFVWTVLTVTTAPALRRNARAWTAISVAAVAAAALFYDPSPLAWLIFLAALATASLVPRFAQIGNAALWAIRLGVQAIVSVIGPWRDLYRLRRAGQPLRAATRSIWPLLPLPILGTAVFAFLFISANPVLDQVVGSIAWPDLDWTVVPRTIFLGFVGTMVWATLRPRRVRLNFPAVEVWPWEIPGVSVGSVTLSLILFNALFALQNGLDLAFLWSDAALPDGVTLADYAHRGAYPLIATALLAGLFVLVTLRPGSATAAAPLIRGLVILWVAQNVFLVASSVLRTLDYIDAYSLTHLRIAALIWMGLVAVGLLLILWRMLTGKSATWLVNANAGTAGALLLAVCFVDLGSVAAQWNVRHAREVGGRGAELDLCYLNQLGPSALVSLAELEVRTGLKPDFRERVSSVRLAVSDRIAKSALRGDWILRNDLRFEQAATALDHAPPMPRPVVSLFNRECDGSVPPPPVVEESADAVDSANLTAEEAR